MHLSCEKESWFSNGHLTIGNKEKKKSHKVFKSLELECTQLIHPISTILLITLGCALGNIGEKQIK